MNSSRLTTVKLIGVSLLAAAGLVALDLLLPAGVVIWIPLIALVLVSLWSRDRSVTIWLAAVCSVLIVLGYLHSPAGVAPWIAILNRTIGVLAIWTAALLLLKHKNAEAARAERERRADEVETSRLQRLREQHTALIDLAKNEAIHGGRLDEAFHAITETAARVLGVGRASVWFYDDDRLAIRLSDLFEHSRGVHSEGATLSARHFPDYFKALEQEERAVVASDAHRDPRTREFSDAYLRPLGIGAMLDAPIRVKGRVIGVLCHEHLGGSRAWSADEQNFAGSLATMVSLAIEASRRRGAEETLQRQITALLESEERFRQLTDQIREVFWLTNPDKTEMLYISPGYEEVWQRSCASLYQSPQSWLESIHPEDRSRVLDAAKNRQVSGDYNEVYRIVRPDGSIRWVQDRAFPIRNRARVIYRIAGIAEDITERKQAEEALRDSEQRFRSVAQTAIDAIILADATGRILFWNQAAEKMFGYTTPEALDRPLSILIPERYRALHERGMERFRATGEGRLIGRTIEIHGLRKDGQEFPLELSLASWRTGKRTYYCGIIRDIAERQRADAALLESERQRRQLLESRERLAQDLHDDIIQSIYAVGLGLEECRRALQGSSMTARRLNEAISGLNGVIRDVRHYITGLQPAMQEGRNMMEAVSSLVTTMSRAGTISFSVKVNPTAGARLAPDEAAHVLLIIWEGMSNTLRHSRARASSITLGLHESGVRLELRDDGIGFDPAAVHGHGHGLQNIQARARKIRGELSVVSAPGLGTHLVLDIPLARRR